MKRHFLWILGLTLVFIITFSACCHKQHLEVTKSLIAFGYAGGLDLFNVEADCEWTIETDNTQDWLTIKPLSGSNNATVTVTALKNNSLNNRTTSFTVVSENGKIRHEITVAQSKIDINPIVNKVWFLRFYERWNTDYWDNYIPESYRTWTYYTDYENLNYYFYFFDDNTGYQIKTQTGDTIYYPFQYDYHPEYDSLIIAFRLNDNEIEDYHAIVYELTESDFSFSNAYTPHTATKSPHFFEKLNLVNVSTNRRNELKINPKKVASKPTGPLIEVK